MHVWVLTGRHCGWRSWQLVTGHAAKAKDEATGETGDGTKRRRYEARRRGFMQRANASASSARALQRTSGLTSISTAGVFVVNGEKNRKRVLGKDEDAGAQVAK